MKSEEIIFKPIGVIHSIYTNVDNMPKRPQQSGNTEASIEINPKFKEAISDIKRVKNICLYFIFINQKVMNLLFHYGE